MGIEGARVSWRCPSCGRGLSLGFGEGTARECPGCRAAAPLHADALDAEGRLRACAVCESRDLYRRKALPKGVGLAVVGVAAAATIVMAQIASVPPWAIYAPLFLAAAIDALLYFTTADAVGCYRCRAIHRGLPPAAPLQPFDLERADEIRLGRKVGAPSKRGP